MTEPVRLAKRVAELAACSRRDAELYIEGGWVSVDGQIVELPQHKITTERVEIDANAELAATEPATILLHKPAGVEFVNGESAAASLVTTASHCPDDASGVRVLKRHFTGLTPLMPLDTEASGLIVLSQDGRVWRRLTEDWNEIEQEFVVEVEGELVPYGLSRLGNGLSYCGRALAPCKVSWQSEARLRFAIKAVQPGQLRHMCAEVGLKVISIKRLRIGRISLSKMASGTWRYMPTRDRF
jgi:23S rRNA pseudouridine2604 synthase